MNDCASQYVYWVDWKDSLAEWKTNEDCRRYDYVQEVDALKGCTT